MSVVFPRHIQIPCSFPFATIIMLSLFSNKNNNNNKNPNNNNKIHTGVLKPNIETTDGKKREHLWRYRKIFADHEQLSWQSGNL